MDDMSARDVLNFANFLFGERDEIILLNAAYETTGGLLTEEVLEGDPDPLNEPRYPQIWAVLGTLDSRLAFGSFAINSDMELAEAVNDLREAIEGLDGDEAVDDDVIAPLLATPIRTAAAVTIAMHGTLRVIRLHFHPDLGYGQAVAYLQEAMQQADEERGGPDGSTGPPN